MQARREKGVSRKEIAWAGAPKDSTLPVFPPIVQRVQSRLFALCRNAYDPRRFLRKFRELSPTMTPRFVERRPTEREPQDTPRGARGLVAGATATAVGILGSRLLGFVRDIATAAVLGGSPVMDALVIALRAPNMFRRLFGEGALAACYVPVLADQLQRDREAAWRLTTGMLMLLAAGLAGIVVAGEAGIFVAWRWWADREQSRLVLALSAVMLPYLWFICIAAQLAATLQTLGRFAAAASGAVLFNLCWLAGIWLWAPRLASDPAGQGGVIALCVVVSGLLQAIVQAWALWKCGFRWRLDLPACREALGKIGRGLGPLVLALGIAQLSVVGDSTIAWLLSAPAPGSLHDGVPIAGSLGFPGLGSTIRYPLTAGALSSIYYAERFYQAPVGIIGVALATAVFPLLSRHAARGQLRAAAIELGRSLRLAWFAAAPIAVSLALLAEPFVRLAFEHGRFGLDDTRRTAGMIVVHAAGMLALCSLPILTRAAYALGESRLVIRMALVGAVAGISLDLLLVWPLAERGLALATTLAASASRGTACRAQESLSKAVVDACRRVGADIDERGGPGDCARGAGRLPARGGSPRGRDCEARGAGYRRRGSLSVHRVDDGQPRMDYTLGRASAATAPQARPGASHRPGGRVRDMIRTA